ncbi:MAG: response regulator [Proteobacteria bacterium]|nr:response regulator [Pseudomonadota bacterium]
MTEAGGKHPADLSGCTILVVDDTEANLDLLVETLGDDYEVSVAMDGASALEAIEEDPPDLILLDIMMPGIDGYEVCRRLKDNEATRDIPVLFVTAMSDVRDETRGLELGAVDYITKPISPPIVKARVKNHLELKLAREDLKQQNEVLRENVRLQEEVERIARHDLKTPLNAVLTVPAMLAGDPNLTPEQVDMLNMLEESGYRMLEIINSSMDLLKIEKGSYQLKPVPVDVLKLVHQIRGETRDMFRAKGLTLEVTLDGRPVKETDSLRLAGEEMLYYSMLANLIKNAVEASPPGAAVGISFESGRRTIIHIHNQGEVPLEIRDRFFEKYATSGKEGGTGLGTYSARLIARTLGGTIDFSSSRQAGTTLTLNLPPAVKMDQVADEPGPVDGEPTQTALQGDILIVDDYPHMRRIIRSILRSMGFKELQEAGNGHEALKAMEQGKIALIISDVNMPRMNGLELLRQVRASVAWAQTPFIMVTGEADQETVLAASKARVDGYLVKPFSPDILRGKISRLFRLDL